MLVRFFYNGYNVTIDLECCWEIIALLNELLCYAHICYIKNLENLLMTYSVAFESSTGPLNRWKFTAANQYDGQVLISRSIGDQYYHWLFRSRNQNHSWVRNFSDGEKLATWALKMLNLCFYHLHPIWSLADKNEGKATKK